VSSFESVDHVGKPPVGVALFSNPATHTLRMS